MPLGIWRDHAAACAHIAFEAHPGFAVYNPETLLKLRRLAGDNLGANLDPSHFFWQGIEPVVQFSLYIRMQYDTRKQKEG